MSPEEARIRYDSAHDYLEVARAAAAVLGPPGQIPTGHHHHSGVHNAVFAVLSMSTVFSYLAVEAAVDQSLPEAAPDAPPAALEERIRAACRAAGIPGIEEQDPALWAGLRALAEDARALLSDAPPLPGGRQALAESLMARPEPLTYAAVAQAVLRHLRTGERAAVPEWLERNTLLDFRAFLAE